MKYNEVPINQLLYTKRLSRRLMIYIITRKDQNTFDYLFFSSLSDEIVYHKNIKSSIWSKPDRIWSELQIYNNKYKNHSIIRDIFTMPIDVRE